MSSTAFFVDNLYTRNIYPPSGTDVTINGNATITGNLTITNYIVTEFSTLDHVLLLGTNTQIQENGTRYLADDDFVDYGLAFNSYNSGSGVYLVDGFLATGDYSQSIGVKGTTPNTLDFRVPNGSGTGVGIRLANRGITNFSIVYSDTTVSSIAGINQYVIHQSLYGSSTFVFPIITRPTDFKPVLVYQSAPVQSRNIQMGDLDPANTAMSISTGVVTITWSPTSRPVSLTYDLSGGSITITDIAWASETPPNGTRISFIFTGNGTNTATINPDLISQTIYTQSTATITPSSGSPEIAEFIVISGNLYGIGGLTKY